MSPSSLLRSLTSSEIFTLIFKKFILVNLNYRRWDFLLSCSHSVQLICPSFVYLRSIKSQTEYRQHDDVNKLPVQQLSERESPLDEKAEMQLNIERRDSTSIRPSVRRPLGPNSTWWLIPARLCPLFSTHTSFPPSLHLISPSPSSCLSALSSTRLSVSSLVNLLRHTTLF